jgi:hypothetical protein
VLVVIRKQKKRNSQKKTKKMVKLRKHKTVMSLKKKRSKCLKEI